MKNRVLQLVVMAMLSMSWGAFGATREVGSGKTYTTIQSAIDAAGSGDTILVYPGTYEEYLYVANYDANGDHDFEDAGDKDFSGLSIIGTDRDSVIINPNIGGVPDLDTIRNDNNIYAYDPDKTSGVVRKAGLLVDVQQLWSPRSESTYEATLRPHCDDNDGLPQAYFSYKQHAAAAQTAGTEAGALDGVTIKNLTFMNCHTGIGLRGFVTNAVVDNVKIENTFNGFGTYGGVRGLRFSNNTLLNTKYGLYIGYGTQDTEITDNTLLMDNNNPTAFEQHGSDHRAIRILNYDSSTKFQKSEGYALENVLVARNTVDYSAYTGPRHIIGVELSGGRNVEVSGNTITGVVKAFWIYYVSWFGTTESYNINGNEISEFLNGLDMSPYVGQTVSGNSFSDFVPNGAVPWTVESMFGKQALHAAPDPARGNQNLSRTFAVPATGTTTLTFNHWFSQTGHMYLEIMDSSGDWTPLKKSLYDENSGSVIRQYWGDPMVADDARRHGYEPDCSGWYTPGVPIPGDVNTANGGLLDSPYDGLTTNGILGETVNLTPYAGQTVTLRFRQFGATYGEKGCWACTVNGLGDLAGWYVSDFKVSNDLSGTLMDTNDQAMDETGGAVLANWTNDSDTPSYAISLGNKDRTHTGALRGTAGFRVIQNTIANPNGDGILIRHDATSDAFKMAVNDNEFFNNGNSAIRINAAADVTQTVNAENNWWGSSTGPNHQGNPSGTGDLIDDPNGVVDFTPWVLGLSANSITAASFTAGTRSACSGAGYTVTFYSFDGSSNPPVLGTLGCNGTFSGNGTQTEGPVLIRFQATNAVDMPDFIVGDFIQFTTNAGAYRAYLPVNTNATNTYGTSIYFWPASDGEVYFAGKPGNRFAAPGSANFQNFTASRNGVNNVVGGVSTPDAAQRVGSFEYSLTFNAGSDFNWIGMPHFRTDISKASQLFAALNAQYVAGGGVGNLVRTIQKWNPASQTYTQFTTIPFVTGNFDMALGEAYRIETNDRAHVWSVTGAEPAKNTVTYTLRKTQSTGINFLSLPWYKANVLKASELATDVNNHNSSGQPVVVSIQNWNSTSQTFVEHIPGGPTGDFNVRQGQAYRIDVSGTVTYTPVQ